MPKSISPCVVCNNPCKQRCSLCKSVFYCSRECQEGDWKEHQKACLGGSPIKDAQRSPIKDAQRKKVTDGAIYEWKQGLDDVDIYIQPPRVSSKMLDVNVTATHLTVGIKGNPPYISEDLAGVVISKSSFWMMENGELHIKLQKARSGEWSSVLKVKRSIEVTPEFESYALTVISRQCCF